MRIAAFVWGVILLVGIAVAQAPPAAPAFEVAAIKAAGMPTPDTMRSGQFRTGTKINAQSADFEFVTLADLVPYAYGVKSFQVAGPASMRETRWNIAARLPDGASQDQVPEMMRALLIDRFKLAVHHEKREQPVYELSDREGRSEARIWGTAVRRLLGCGRRDSGSAGLLPSVRRTSRRRPSWPGS